MEGHSCSDHRHVVVAGFVHDLRRKDRTLVTRAEDQYEREGEAADLSLANMEVLVAAVDGAVLRSACPNETQTLKQTFMSTCLGEKNKAFSVRGHLGVGGQLHSFLSGHTVTGVEDGGAGYGPKQG